MNINRLEISINNILDEKLNKNYLTTLNPDFSHAEKPPSILYIIEKSFPFSLFIAAEDLPPEAQ
jgi:hypothetical protein